MSIEERVIESSVFGVNLKIFTKGNEVYIIGNEVIRRLRLKNSRQIISYHVKEKNKIALKEFCKDLSEERKSEIFLNLSPLTILIKEPVFYKLCLWSTIPELGPFQEWVCNMLVDIRKGNNLGFEEFIKDNPVETIQKTIEKVPSHNPKSGNKERKEMNKGYKDGHEKAKDPYQVEAGRVGGATTQQNIRDLKESAMKAFNALKDVLDRLNLT